MAEVQGGHHANLARRTIIAWPFIAQSGQHLEAHKLGLKTLLWGTKTNDN